MQEIFSGNMEMFGFVSVLLLSISIISLTKSDDIEANLLDIKPWKKMIYAPTFHANGISVKCSGDTRRYVEALFHGEKWANSMYEASGKLSEDFYNFTSVGIRGSRTSRHETGLFDQCISIGLDEFEGQYCTLLFEVEPVTEDELLNDGKRRETVPKIRNSISQSLIFPDSISSILGTIEFCLPSSCTAQDLKTAVSQIVGMNNIGPGNNYTVVTIGNDNYCHSREKIESSFNLKEAAILIFLTIFIILVVLVLLGTVLEALDAENCRSNHQILLSFSAINNGRHLFSARRSSFDNISCMNGIRVLLECLIVIIHAGLDIVNYRSYNNKDLRNFLKGYLTLFGDAPLFVEPFFVMSGILISSSLLSFLDRSKGKINILVLYLLRILRFLPVYSAVLFFEAFIVEHLGSGPDWYSIKEHSQSCRKNWWTHLLYLNNYYQTDDIHDCMRYTWHLAVDTQLFWLSPFFVYILWRFRKLGLILLGITISVAILLDATVQSIYNLPPSFFYLGAHESSTSEYNSTIAISRHFQTYNKLPGYLSGILLGWIFHQLSKAPKVYISKKILTIGWISATSAILWSQYSILYYAGENKLMMIPSNYPWLSVIMGSLRGLSYSLATCWIIFVCHLGYSDRMTRFLSWDLFLPFSRMSFTVFLIHDTFIKTMYSISRKPIYFTVLSHVFDVGGILLFSILASTAINLFIEIPFKNLQRIFFQSIIPTDVTIGNKPKNL